MPEAESGSNMARIAALLRAGLPDTTPGVTINRFCSSGLQSIAMAADRIRGGGAHILIAGGSESMSMIPMAGNNPAPNPWFAEHHPQVYMNMGLTAERGAAQVRHFARRRRRLSLTAAIRMPCAPRREGKFTDEIVPVKVETTVLNGTAEARPHRNGLR